MFKLGFSNPGFLLAVPVALLAVAVLWYLSVWSYRKARQAYGEPRLVDRYTRRVSIFSQVPSLVGWLVLLALILISAAGPTLPKTPHRVNAGSLQVMAVFDVSKSMEAQDYADAVKYDSGLRFFGPHGTRLDEAKNVLTNSIMPSLTNNELGLVTYKGGGFPLADPTDDFGYINYVLQNWLVAGNAPGGGSDMGSGLKVAIDEFKRYGSPNSEKVIVLFSDGGNDGDPALMAQDIQEMNALHIRLIVIGMGGQPIPVATYDKDGQFAGYYQIDGVTALTGIDEHYLTELANAAHGQYIHLDPRSLPNINWPSALAGASKIEIKNTDLYMYPLGAAFVLVALLGLKGSYRPAFGWIVRRVRKRSSVANSGAGRKGQL